MASVRNGQNYAIIVFHATEFLFGNLNQQC